MFPARGEDARLQNPKIKRGASIPVAEEERDGENVHKALLCIVARTLAASWREDSGRARAGPEAETEGSGPDPCVRWAGHPAAGHTFPPGSAFCFWRCSRTVWLRQQQERWHRESLRASPAQAALPSRRSCLHPRHGRDGSPGPACLGTFLAGRRRTGKFHLFFRNFHVWGSCPWVSELGKHVGKGVCMRRGAQRHPSQPAGQQVVRIHARLTRRQSRDEEGSGLLPSGCSLSPCASRVGLVAQPGHPHTHLQLLPPRDSLGSGQA